MPESILGEEEEVVEAHGKALRLLFDDAADACDIVRGGGAGVQRAPEAEDGRERRLEVVRDVGDEGAHLRMGAADAFGHGGERFGEFADLVAAAGGHVDIERAGGHLAGRES